MKRGAFLITIFFLTISLQAVSLSAAFSYKLPVDFFIGQIIDPEENSIEAKTQVALKEFYSLDWVEEYVPEGMREGFVHTYDHLLSNVLPAEQLQIAKPIKLGALVEIPFRIFSPQPLTGLLVWVKSDEGEPFLLSLSITE